MPLTDYCHGYELLSMQQQQLSPQEEAGYEVCCPKQRAETSSARLTAAVINARNAKKSTCNIGVRAKGGIRLFKQSNTN